MAVGTSSEGISGETGMAGIQAHLTAVCKMAESDESTAKPEKRKTEDEQKKNV
jgi:hypothetical protein